MVEAQACGGYDNGQKIDGYVKLNEIAVWQASMFGEYPRHRGANVMIVDTSSCTLQEWHNFDTYRERAAAARLRDYLEGLSDGTVLVGVSCDEASQFLSDALPTLSALGADVSSVGSNGAWVFAAVKGDPSDTVLDKQNTEGEANARQTHISITYGNCDICLPNIIAELGRALAIVMVTLQVNGNTQYLRVCPKKLWGR